MSQQMRTVLGKFGSKFSLKKITNINEFVKSNAAWAIKLKQNSAIKFTICFHFEFTETRVKAVGEGQQPSKKPYLNVQKGVFEIQENSECIKVNFCDQDMHLRIKTILIVVDTCQYIYELNIRLKFTCFICLVIPPQGPSYRCSCGWLQLYKFFVTIRS